MGGACGTYGGSGLHKVLVGKHLRERGHWGDQTLDGRIILRWISKKWEGVVRTGWSWLRIRTGGGRLWVRWWTLGFHKMRGISWLAAKPVSFSRRTLLHGASNYVRVIPQSPHTNTHTAWRGAWAHYQLIQSLTTDTLTVHESTIPLTELNCFAHSLLFNM